MLRPALLSLALTSEGRRRALWIAAAATIALTSSLCAATMNACLLVAELMTQAATRGRRRRVLATCASLAPALAIAFERQTRHLIGAGDDLLSGDRGLRLFEGIEVHYLAWMVGATPVASVVVVLLAAAGAIVRSSRWARRA